jgi:hypothetical protein
MRNILSKVVEKIATYIVSAVPLSENRAGFKIMCIARQATDDNIMRRKRSASCTPEATGTHSEYILRLFSTAIMVPQTRLIVTLYLHRLPY